MVYKSIEYVISNSEDKFRKILGIKRLHLSDDFFESNIFESFLV